MRTIWAGGSVDSACHHDEGGVLSTYNTVKMGIIWCLSTGANLNRVDLMNESEDTEGGLAGVSNVYLDNVATLTAAR